MADRKRGKEKKAPRTEWGPSKPLTDADGGGCPSEAIVHLRSREQLKPYRNRGKYSPPVRLER
jgi:hypothetical protein